MEPQSLLDSDVGLRLTTSRFTIQQRRRPGWMEHIEKYPLEKPMEDSQLYHPIISITFFNREDDVAAGRKCSKNRSQVASAICVAV